MNNTIIVLVGLINALAFIYYGLDKRKAKNNQRRIPESTLLIFVLVGGGVGALLSMMMFRHKTSKPSFLIKFGIAWVVFLFILYLILPYFKY